MQSLTSRRQSVVADLVCSQNVVGRSKLHRSSWFYHDLQCSRGVVADLKCSQCILGMCSQDVVADLVCSENVVGL